jgi:cyclopropane fatty-acyl-phospholipid synthase-like methyltransferase
MFNQLSDINKKPEPFEFYTAAELWTEEHTSHRMLEYHLNKSVDAASRNHDFIDRSSEWIISNFKLNNGSKVIDFGCGPGLYTSRLAESGAIVTGIDFSVRSIEYARKEALENNLKINYIMADYLEHETDERYDLIIMIMCDFCALSFSQRKRLLSKFSRLLRPEGSILLDVYSFNYFGSIKEQAVYGFNMMDNFWSADDYYCFLNTFRYADEKLILDKYAIYDKKGMRLVYNWLQCFNEQTIRKEFEENSLVITDFYSNVSGDSFSAESGEFAIVARKK